jgi:hypothetical protein
MHTHTERERDRQREVLMPRADPAGAADAAI